MNKGLVSIILPVYNSEEYLERCLNSILMQSYKNFELIVINDGSKDASMQILKKYSINDKRIKIIDKINEGVSTARNIGIKNAQGEFTTFIDADDWLEVNAIQIYYDYMQQNPDVDVVRGNCYINYNEVENFNIRNMYELSNKKFEKNAINDKVLKYFLLNKKSIQNLVMLLFIRTEKIKGKIEFNKDLFMMEDVVFYFDLFQKINKIAFLDLPLYHYYQNENSVTHSKSKYLHNIEGIFSTNRYLRKKIEDYKIADTNILKKMNATHLRICSDYMFMFLRYKSDGSKSEIKKVVQKNAKVLSIMKIDLSELKIRDKISVFLLKNKFISLLIIYIKMYNFLKKRN